MLFVALKITLNIVAAILSVFCTPDTVAVSSSLSHMDPGRKILLALFLDEKIEDRGNKGMDTRS